MDRGACQATVHALRKEWDKTEQLSRSHGGPTQSPGPKRVPRGAHARRHKHAQPLRHYLRERGVRERGHAILANRLSHHTSV